MPVFVFSISKETGITVTIEGPVNLSQIIDNSTPDAVMQATVSTTDDFRVLSPWAATKAPFSAVLAGSGVVNGIKNYDIIYQACDPLCPRHILSEVVLEGK